MNYRRIKVRSHTRTMSSGKIINIQSHHRYIMHRVPRQPRMIRAGVREWYTQNDLAKNPDIIERKWFTPPKKFIRLDKTRNWWRFRLINPEKLKGMYIEEKYDNEGRVIQHVVKGFDKKTGQEREQAIRYPIAGPFFCEDPIL